jgi:hypothetical protein
MGFREQYLRYGQPSAQREEFVLSTILNLPKNQVVKNMKPVTVSKPDGTKITYEVMTDYITVDGMRVPMSGITAQKIADHFGLNLPTPQMVDEIYRNADVQVVAQPLSGSGTTVDGQRYSGNDVVQKGVGYAPFAVAYNDKINQQLAEQNAQPGGDQIVAGFAKDIVPPVKPGSLGLYGLYNAQGKPIQGGNGQTPHNIGVHTEYGSFVRLVSPTVTIEYPGGQTANKPLGSVYQYASYTPTESSNSEQQVAQNEPNKSQTARMQLLQRINKFFEEFGA